MATWTAYTSFPAKALNKEIDWDTDTLKVMLCTATYTPDQNNHAYKSSVTNEITATGYTAGGATVTGASITVSGGGTHAVKFTFDNVSWASITAASGALKWAVLYKDTGGVAATSPLIAYGDLGGVTPNGAYVISIDGAGVLVSTTP